MFKYRLIFFMLLPLTCLSQSTDTRKNLDPDSPEMRYAEQMIAQAETLSENKEWMNTLHCASGECDKSQPEPANDVQEGLSRLGALAGSSDEVSRTQVLSGMPLIFAGAVKRCKKYPLGFRDCCTDSGWGDWVSHCPDDLKRLQQAKAENRVVALGSYQKNKLSARHYSFCVFPTKLAAIVQIQGRGWQLGLPFGSAKHPDCRGLMPEELERIDFGRLDLTPLQQELIARMAVPDSGLITTKNQEAVEQLTSGAYAR